jgi:hypothetical protein
VRSWLPITLLVSTLAVTPVFADQVPVGAEVAPIEAAGAAARRVHDFVPRNLQVSIAKDHVWGSVRSEVVPADLGEESWARWDRDGDGALIGSEVRALGAHVRALELEYLCIAVDDTVLPLLRMPVKRTAPVEEPVALDARIVFSIEGRAAIDVGPGEHSFVLYDRPRGLDGVVPFRVSLVQGLEFVRSDGARAEAVGDRRLEAVVSMFAPATWGTFRLREAVVPTVSLPAKAPAP